MIMFAARIVRPESSKPFFQGFNYGNGRAASIHVNGSGTASGFTQRKLPDGQVEEEGFLFAESPEEARVVLRGCISKYWLRRMPYGQAPKELLIEWP